jgi:hypothetical protein
MDPDLERTKFRAQYRKQLQQRYIGMRVREHARRVAVGFYACH